MDISREPTPGSPATAGGMKEGCDGSLVDLSPDTPRPRPMDVEEFEWDREEDCLPLPKWKVSTA